MIVVRLIDSDHCHFGRWIGEVGVCCANRKPCDVGNTGVVSSACVGRVANVEMTVGCIVRIERHAENSAALALSDFERNIEKWGRIDRSRWKIDDLDESVLLGHKKTAGASGRCTYVKRGTESVRDSDRINAVPGAAGRYRQR